MRILDQVQRQHAHTDSVKQHILENRVYRPKIEQEVVLKHITIQNNHITQINNYFDEDMATL